MGEFDQVLGGLSDAWAAASAQLKSGWFLTQAGVVLAAILLAPTVAALVRRRLDLVTLTMGWPAFLRMAVRSIVANFGILIFLLLVLVGRVGLRVLPGVLPGPDYLLRAAASLAAAWLLINLLASFIRNRFVLRLVAFTAWVVAALIILGILEPMVAALDTLAVQLGNVRLSALLALKTLVLLLLGLWAALALSGFIENRLGKEADLTPSIQVLIGKLARVALITLAIVVVVSSVGIDLSALALFSGAVGVGIGFGLQKVVSNLISGIILLADKSIKPGDVITVGDTFGWVTKMGARFTSVVTRDGREYLIPNEDLITHRVLNWSHHGDKVRLDVHFSVSGECNPHDVRRIAEQAVASVPRVIKDPGPISHLTGFGQHSTLDFILRFWIHDPVEGVTNIRGAVLLALWDAFTREGIKVPYSVTEARLVGPVELVSKGPDEFGELRPAAPSAGSG
jgi:small-conductance mechanosensitive channel